MTEGIEAVTTAALGLALDAASLRQQVIAANVANANVDGYLPLRVDFESQLDEARGELNESGTAQAGALAGVSPVVQPAFTAGALGASPKVMLDLEMALMASNGVQYQALATGLTKHFAILSMAVDDGKK